jgi:hypothetical protein
MSHISESLKGELKCVTIGAHLQHFDLFAHTSSKTLAKLAALCEELIFTVSEMIEAAGQTASGLSIVIQGYVKITDQHIGYVRRISNPGYYGQTSLFRHEMWKCSVISETVSEVVRLSRSSLHSLIDIYPNMGDQYFEIREQLDTGNFMMVGTNSDEWGKELQLIEHAGRGSVLDNMESHHTELLQGGQWKVHRTTSATIGPTTPSASPTNGPTNGLTNGDEIPGTVPRQNAQDF